MIKMLSVLAICFATACSVKANATIVGDTVRVTEYYAMDPGTSHVAVSSNTIVGGGVEYPNIDGFSIDFQPNSITLTLLDHFTYNRAQFVDILEFVDLTTPFITATLDPSTTPALAVGRTPSFSSFSHDGSVDIGVAGIQAYNVGDKIVIDVTTAPVPEPATLPILAAGALGTLLVTKRRRAGGRSR